LDGRFVLQFPAQHAEGRASAAQNHGASHGVRSLKAHDRAEFRCLAGVVPAKALHSILLLGPGDPCRGSGRAAGGLRAAGACTGRGRCLYWPWPVLVLAVAGACTGRGRCLYWSWPVLVLVVAGGAPRQWVQVGDRKSTRLNSSHVKI